MRMNIQIEGKQTEMSVATQQRTKRCLRVLQDIGFDIRIKFTEDSPELSYIIPNYPPEIEIPLKYLKITEPIELAEVVE